MNKKIDNAMMQYEMAANQMMNAILDVVNKNGEVTYEVVVDESCGFNEYRTIESDGFIYDENDCKCGKVNDLTCDELYHICKYIMKQM